jgi:hypothetical protein
MLDGFLFISDDDLAVDARVIHVALVLCTSVRGLSLEAVGASVLSLCASLHANVADNDWGRTDR